MQHFGVPNCIHYEGIFPDREERFPEFTSSMPQYPLRRRQKGQHLCMVLAVTAKASEGMRSPAQKPDTGCSLEYAMRISQKGDYLFFLFPPVAVPGAVCTGFGIIAIIFDP